MEFQGPSEVYVGIDPGVSGGIAVVDAAGKVKLLLGFKECSTREIVSRIDHAICRLGNTSYVAVERVHVSTFSWASKGEEKRRMGVKSAGVFMHNVGVIDAAVCHCDEWRISRPTPGEWRKGLQIPATDTRQARKPASRAVAEHMFPVGLKRPDTMKVTHATADALLLAEYCRRYHRGLLPPTEGGQRHGKAKGRKETTRAQEDQRTEAPQEPVHPRPRRRAR